MRENRLKYQKSPYLLQHRDNPIHWFAWEDEAFEVAKVEEKPIFLSIGYATCHWCHVMEGDSFEDAEVAEILNKYFVPIKVDREERPDVDSVYMKAVQALTGQGGWPLSVLMTPDRKPFWGGTFLPKDQFKMVLKQAHDLWESERQQEVVLAAERITKALAESMEKKATDGWMGAPAEVLKSFYWQCANDFDEREGGFGTAPKFPPSMTILSLFRIFRRSENPKALEMGLQTLKAMARGGLHDVIGGGFHRYSTDHKWLVPHFEKMLYDNALLLLAFSEAYQLTQDPEFKEVALKICHYVWEVMEAEEGGYFSAEDADSEKTEGKFYVWTWQQLEETLTPEEMEFVVSELHAEKNGNFTVSRQIEELEQAAGLKSVQNANILHRDKNEPLLNENEEPVKTIVEKLRLSRSKRVRPLLDDKVLTSWNGLMIAGMARAYQVFQNERCLESAEKAAKFVLTKLCNSYGLMRRYRDGEAIISGYLEDYSYMIFGLWELYQANFDSLWLKELVRLQALQDRYFWDSESGGYFDTDGLDKTVILRHKEFFDNATPSGNSVAALNLLRLHQLTGQSHYREKAEKILQIPQELMRRYPRAFPFLTMALDFFDDEAKEFVVLVPDMNSEAIKTLSRSLNKLYEPNTIRLIGAEGERLPLVEGRSLIGGETTYYVCRGGTCQLPVTDQEQAFAQLEKKKHLSLA